MAVRPLACDATSPGEQQNMMPGLIYVNDSTEGEYFRIDIEGDEATCNPNTLVASFPALLSSAIVVEQPTRSSINSPQGLVEFIDDCIGSSSACIIDVGYYVSIFTRNRELHTKLLEELIKCL